MRRVRHTSGLSFYEETSKVNLDLLGRVVLWLVITAAAIGLGIAFVLFLGFRVVVSGNSMQPLIVDGQQVFINKIAYQVESPQAGDVIAYYPGGNKDTYPMVCRVVATPKETVQILEGRLLVNGIPYSDDEIYSNIKDAGIAEQVITLGEEEYFILGDNTVDAEDSRSAGVGAIRETDLIGKVWLRLPCRGGTMGIVE